MTYRVYYEGFYIIEAESVEDALQSDKDDAEVQYEEWENTKAQMFEAVMANG